MHKIQLFKEQREINCAAESTILKATLGAQINHTHACGGQGKCSTCRVSIMAGLDNCEPRNETEQRMAKMLHFPDQIRLACQTVIKGDVAIRRMVSDQLDVDLISKQFSDGPEAALGSQQNVTIVFTDIVNYTALAERFPPYDIVHVLQRYFRIMNDVIVAHQGIISDVAGDGILAVFGIDQTERNSVLDAVQAIRGMQEKLTIFNDYLKENFNVTFGIRAGVHYGNVIVGPFDTGAMKKLAVIGDNVNYASRIESANKKFGTKLLLSKEAYEEIKDQYSASNTYETSLKGKTGVFTLVEI